MCLSEMIWSPPLPPSFPLIINLNLHPLIINLNLHPRKRDIQVVSDGPACTTSSPCLARGPRARLLPPGSPLPSPCLALQSCGRLSCAILPRIQRPCSGIAARGSAEAPLELFSGEDTATQILRLHQHSPRLVCTMRVTETRVPVALLHDYTPCPRTSSHALLHINFRPCCLLLPVVSPTSAQSLARCLVAFRMNPNLLAECAVYLFGGLGYYAVEILYAWMGTWFSFCSLEWSAEKGPCDYDGPSWGVDQSSVLNSGPEVASGPVKPLRRAVAGGGRACDACVLLDGGGRMLGSLNGEFVPSYGPAFDLPAAGAGVAGLEEPEGLALDGMTSSGSLSTVCVVKNSSGILTP